MNLFNIMLEKKTKNSFLFCKSVTQGDNLLWCNLFTDNLAKKVGHKKKQKKKNKKTNLPVTILTFQYRVG